MIALTLAERYRQARLYAAQVRRRRAMGDSYSHARPWRGPNGIKSGYINTRRIESEQFEK